MRNREVRGFHQSSTGRHAAFDEKKIESDVLSAISRLLADGKEFAGHDGRRYAILSVNKEESESESFIDVVARFDEGNVVVAKYAIVLQPISH